MINNKRCNDLSGTEWLQNSFSIWRDLTKTKEERSFGHPASFPVSLCEKLMRTFARSDCKVLDPFNGIGSTTKAASNLNLEAVGIDLSFEYCEIARERVTGNQKIQIVNGNSNLVLDNYSSALFDICVTSPPYWDILNMKRSADKKDSISYSDNEADLGNISSYEGFLDSLSSVFTKVFRVLKSGSYCIVNVMDIRKKSVFYPLHSDLAIELKKIGFKYDDLIIWDRQADYNNMRPLGYPYRFRINKVHEYLVIFLKE